MSIDADFLLARLPAFYRQRDAELRRREAELLKSLEQP